MQTRDFANSAGHNLSVFQPIHMEPVISSNKSDDAPTTAFSIQSILSNKQLDGVWGALLSTTSSNCEDASDYPDTSLITASSLSRAHRHFEWDSEALDMRMKSHLKGNAKFTTINLIVLHAGKKL